MRPMWRPSSRKLPPLRNNAKVSLAELIDDMLEQVRTQGHKDQRTYESRGGIVRTELGDRAAKALTAPELETWLAKSTKTPATFNRCTALVSLAYKIGVRNKKVTHNLPAVNSYRCAENRGPPPVP
jgi:hypothetical protein